MNATSTLGKLEVVIRKHTELAMLAYPSYGVPTDAEWIPLSLLSTASDRQVAKAYAESSTVAPTLTVQIEKFKLEELGWEYI